MHSWYMPIPRTGRARLAIAQSFLLVALRRVPPPGWRQAD
ncbi:hypothetical protein XOCgx_2724 [Xanthomonas oryzae pv. oryzicola]|nr:hypothetical protein XOCgx_2724 [Xanthomonas oryzae pv. oryzicola]